MSDLLDAVGLVSALAILVVAADSMLFERKQRRLEKQRLERELRLVRGEEDGR